VKKILGRILLITILLSLFITPSFAEESIKITLDGKVLNASAVLENGTVSVPLRTIFESLGASVEWVSETKEIKANRDNIKVNLQIDNKTATHNGKKMELIVPPKLIKGSTYVPLRFVSESFGAVVDWDNKTRSVSIYYKTTKKEITYSSFRDSNKKYGLKDSLGNVIIAGMYDDVRYKSGDLIAAKKGNLWGYVNMSNKVVIPFEYNDATLFYDNYAFISRSTDMTEQSWMLIDKTGKVISKTIFETFRHKPEMHKLANSNYVITAKRDNWDTVKYSYWLLKDKKDYLLLSSGDWPRSSEFQHISDELTLIKRDNTTWIIDIKGNEILRHSVIKGLQQTLQVFDKDGVISLNDDKSRDLNAERLFSYYHEKNGVDIYNSKGEIIHNAIPYTYAYIKDGQNIFIQKMQIIGGRSYDFEIMKIIDFKGNVIFDIENIDKNKIKDIEMPVIENTFKNNTIITYDKNNKIYQVRDLQMDVIFEYKCETLTPVEGDLYLAVVKDEWGNKKDILLNNKGKVVTK